MNRSSNDDNNFSQHSNRYYDSPENDNYELLKHLASHVGRRPAWFNTAKFECGEDFLEVIQHKTLYDPELDRDDAEKGADATIGDGGRQELTTAADSDATNFTDDYESVVTDAESFLDGYEDAIFDGIASSVGNLSFCFGVSSAGTASLDTTLENDNIENNAPMDRDDTPMYHDDAQMDRDVAEESSDATIVDGGIQQELTAAADIKPEVGKPRRNNVIFAPEPRKPTVVLVADGMITKIYEYLPYEERHQLLPPKA